MGFKLNIPLQSYEDFASIVGPIVSQETLDTLSHQIEKKREQLANVASALPVLLQADWRLDGDDFFEDICVVAVPPQGETESAEEITEALEALGLSLELLGAVVDEDIDYDEDEEFLDDDEDDEEYDEDDEFMDEEF